MKRIVPLCGIALIAAFNVACTTMAVTDEAAAPAIAFEQVDTDQDGVLSREEASAKSLSFDTLDTDDDGWITSFEYHSPGAASGSTGGTGDAK
jgi:hypothetical protein